MEPRTIMLACLVSCAALAIVPSAAAETGCQAMDGDALGVDQVDGSVGGHTVCVDDLCKTVPQKRFRID